MTQESQPFARRFADAVRDLERTRDVDRMVSLYAPHAELCRVPQSHVFRGEDGARELWREYLAFFDEIETEFVALHDLGARAVLEWRSRGRLRGGSPIEYAGVSVVEQDEQGRVSRFRTYYDPSHLVGDAARRGADAPRSAPPDGPGIGP